MNLTKPQLLLIAGCLALLFTLYFGGQRKGNKPANPQDNAALALNAAADSNPNPPATLKTQLDMPALAAKLKNKIAQNSADSILYWETQIQNTPATTAKALTQIANLWEKEGYFEMGAHYRRLIARTDSTQNNWLAAANALADAFQLAADSTMRLFLIENAIDAYQKTLQFDTTRLDIKVNIANCYFDAYPNNPQMVMSGVMLLRGVTAIDSTFAPAQLSLGRMAIVSGQFDKAITRLQAVIRKDPTSAEAFYYLGEAYAAMGQKEKAKEAFENCKKLVKNPNFAAELDLYIQRL